MAPSIRLFPTDSIDDRAAIKHDDDTKRMLIIPNIKPMPILNFIAGPEESIQISGSSVLEQLKLEHPDGVSSTGELLFAMLPILEKKATGASHIFASRYEALLQEIENGVEERSLFNTWISLLIREMVHDIFANGPEDPLLQPLAKDDEVDSKPVKEGQTLDKRVPRFRSCSWLSIRPTCWTAHINQISPASDDTEPLEPSTQPDNLIDTYPFKPFNPESDVSHTALQPPPPDVSGDTYPFKPFSTGPSARLPGRDVAHVALQPPPPEASGTIYPFEPFSNDPAVPLPGPVEANAAIAYQNASVFAIMRRSSFDDALNTPYGLMIILGVMFGGAVVFYAIFRVFKASIRAKRRTVVKEITLINGKIHEIETVSS